MPFHFHRLVLPLIVASVSAAQQFTLDRAQNNAVKLSRPANGLVPLRLMYTGRDVNDFKPPTAITISAPSLIGDGKTAAPVNYDNTRIGKGNCDQPPIKRIVDLTEATNVEDLCLYVGPLAPGGTYTGDLTVKADSVKTAVIQVEITQPPVPTPAALTPTSIGVSGPSPFNLILPYQSPTGEQQFDVTLQEKGGKADVEGVVVRMEVVSSPSGYDASKVAAVWTADKSNLFSPDLSRKIPAAQQATAHVTLRDLQPGDYNLVFRFSGINATSDDSQKFTAAVHVRPHWVWPSLVILAASLLSFLANKVVAGKRRRFALLEKIGGLRPAWLGEFADTQPVVWVRAMLSQAEMLSSRYWLTSPDTIEGRVNAVGNVLKLLDEARRLRDRLRDKLDFLVFRRVSQSLDRLVERLGSGSVDDQTVGKFEVQMTSFEDWLNKDRYPTTLWAEIQPGMTRLQAAIAADLPAAPVLPLFAATSAALNAALAAPPTAATADAVYRTFMTLTILWQCRHDSGILAQCDQAGNDLNRFFEIVDHRDWESLKAANLVIQVPSNNDPEGLEAFDPLGFSITAGGAAAEGSYLFHHKMSCSWTFQFTPNRVWFHKRKPITLTPTTVGPSVMQYFPVAGKVAVSAVVSYRGDSHVVPVSAPLEVGPSREFGVLKGFEKAEILSWATALAIAIASGLSIYYLTPAGWGSFKEYLTLFLWGAGVDGGRNFLQSAAGSGKP